MNHKDKNGEKKVIIKVPEKPEIRPEKVEKYLGGLLVMTNDQKSDILLSNDSGPESPRTPPTPESEYEPLPIDRPLPNMFHLPSSPIDMPLTSMVSPTESRYQPYQQTSIFQPLLKTLNDKKVVIKKKIPLLVNSPLNLKEFYDNNQDIGKSIYFGTLSPTSPSGEKEKSINITRCKFGGGKVSKVPPRKPPPLSEAIKKCQNVKIETPIAREPHSMSPTRPIAKQKGISKH